MQHDRRQFLKSTGIVLSLVVAGEVLRVSPRVAQAAGLPYQLLTDDEVSTLQGLAEAVVPGASEAGISHFIDKQLSVKAQDSLLMLKYLGVPADSFIGFYQSGLRNAARLANERFKRPWGKLSPKQAEQLLSELYGDTEIPWEGPPADFFLFVLRSDACDLVYGSEEGFARLGIPYMAHIAPGEVW